MKQLGIITVLILAFSCSEKGERDSITSTQDQIKLPEVFSYQGRNPEMGNFGHLDIIIEWNRRRSDLNNSVSDLLADTLTFHQADGTDFVLARESAMDHVQREYDKYATRNITINAAIPIHYSDIGHDWVYSWVFIETTDKEGISSEMYYHEDYRIEDGKIREVFQFQREPAN